MKLDCQLILKSHLSDGILKNEDHDTKLSKQNFILRFNLDEEVQKTVFSLRNLPIGNQNGVQVISFKINDVDIMSLDHVDVKDFCQFVMKDNPYVSDEIIYETNLVFNGDFIVSLNTKKIFWFPFYFSPNKQDYVFNNHLISCQNDDGCFDGEKEPHRDEWLNLPFHPSIDIDNDSVALGCSVTYGTGVPKKMTWPSLMNFSNYGVSGLGIDGIYYNLCSILESRYVKQAIIVFPNLERRLMFFERDGLHFRIPTAVGNIQGGLISRNYYWIDKKQLAKLHEKTMDKIVKDQDNDYSLHHLEKISKLPCDISVSSWSERTYEILSLYFDKVLPFFENIDVANDFSHHGPQSHSNWVEKIKRYRI